MKLTTEQRQIIAHQSGVGLVCAGPGTAKTTTLVQYIEHTAKQRPTARFLVLCYNVSVMSTLKDKLHNYDTVTVQTIHAFGLSVVSKHYRKFKFTAIPTIAKQTNTKTNTITHNDCIQYTVNLLQTDHSLGSNYHFVLVDEIQDIDKFQTQLLILLAKRIETALLIGDYKQSIYQFRNANPHSYQDFVTHLTPKYYTLSQSFRLSIPAVDFANAVASANQLEAGDALPPLTSSKKGRKPRLIQLRDNEYQYDYLAQTIKQLVRQGYELSDIAILGTKNKFLYSTELGLAARGIVTHRKTDSAETAKWLELLIDAMRFAKFVRNPHQQYIDETLIDSFKNLLQLFNIPTNDYDTLANDIITKIIIEGIEAFMYSKKQFADERDYRRMLELSNAIKNAAREDNVEAATRAVIHGLLAFVREANTVRVKATDKKNTRVIATVQQHFSQIATNVRKHGTWENIEETLCVPAKEQTGVTLTTIHGAKGMEWPIVFVLNVVEGVLPKSASKEQAHVFYVAITRHQNQLYLLQTPLSLLKYPKGRMFHIVLNKTSSLVEKHFELLTVIALPVLEPP